MILSGSNLWNGHGSSPNISLLFLGGEIAKTSNATKWAVTGAFPPAPIATRFVGPKKLHMATANYPSSSLTSHQGLNQLPTITNGSNYLSASKAFVGELCLRV